MKRALNYAAVLLLMLLGVCPQLALICESFGCGVGRYFWLRSEEHTSELQSR